MDTTYIPLENLLAEVRACDHCKDLPLGPRPVVQISASASLLIIGQAPGTRVHETGIPWNDPSGDRLRDWMAVARDTFYKASRIAIMPMGFCYPGRGKSGDLPPRRECAPRWHPSLLSTMPELKLILLVGSYAQKHYLGKGDSDNKPRISNISVAERIRRWPVATSRYFPLVHPSPRNRRWLDQNPWFELEILPVLKQRVAEVIGEVSMDNSEG